MPGGRQQQCSQTGGSEGKRGEGTGAGKGMISVTFEKLGMCPQEAELEQATVGKANP